METFIPYFNKSIKEYIEDLSSSKSSPGGGSVIALSSLQAISLILMLANISLKKIKNKSDFNLIIDFIEKTNKLKKSISLKIDQDIEIFQNIIKAYKKYKTDIKKNNDLINEALKISAEFSYEMLIDIYKILEIVYIIIPMSNKKLISDLAIAINLLFNSIENCIINVRINLKELDFFIHKNFINKLESKMKIIYKKSLQFKKKSLIEVKKFIKLGF